MKFFLPAIFILFIASFGLVDCHIPKHNLNSNSNVDRLNILSFVCNNGDSIPFELLRKKNIGDTIYYSFLDSISDEKLNRLILNEYVNSNEYDIKFRDSMNCEGNGINHLYDISSTNQYSNRLVKINSWNEFLRRSNIGDIYLAITRPLKLNGFKYYLTSIDKNGDLFTGRIWLKVDGNECIREVGRDGGIQ